jgi:hypothetical protein
LRPRPITSEKKLIGPGDAVRDDPRKVRNWHFSDLARWERHVCLCGNCGHRHVARLMNGLTHQRTAYLKIVFLLQRAL